MLERGRVHDRSGAVSDTDIRRQIDEEHLRLLRIGYLVSGSVSAMFALLPLLYAAFGVFIAGSLPGPGPSRASEADPRLFGWLFAAFGLAFFFVLAGNAVLKFFVARAIGRRRLHTFCLVGAALTCLGIPWGTVIGVLTFMVLERPSVKALFGAGPAPGEIPPSL